MKTNLVAAASVDVQAPIDDVWKSLVSPAAIRKYHVRRYRDHELARGRSDRLEGQWNGKPFEAKGIVLQFQPPHLLKYSHFSPLAGAEDEPENYHTVTVELKGE